MACSPTVTVGSYIALERFRHGYVFDELCNSANIANLSSAQRCFVTGNCRTDREPEAARAANMATGALETGHLDMVHDVQLDYYGKRLATCSSDRTVKVFDLSGEQRTLIADLRGHEGPIWQISWAHPRYGSLLASASFDHRVIIWKEGADGQWVQV